MREGSGSLTPAEARVAVTFRGDQPDLGRAYGVEADFLEILILPISVSDRPLPRFWTGEDRHLDPAVIVDPLNPPLAGVHSILKNVRWLRHWRSPPRIPTANAASGSSSPTNGLARL